jgi:tRNA(adenine34) deaminase
MRHALVLAKEAADAGEIPVGSIVVSEGAIVGRGRNDRQRSHDPSGHAEIVALRRAAEAVGDWRIPKSTLYVTLEPCLMCAGAILQARIDRVVFGCRDPKAGAVRSLYAALEDPRAPHRVQVIESVLEEESRALLESFFERLRVDKRGRDAES